MADLIQIRRDRDSVWREVDPVLALAEVGIVQNEDGTMSNPVQFKVGDGTTHWTDLPMQNASAVNKIRVNGSTVLTPTVVGGDRVIDLVIEVSGSVASGNTIAYSDASGHLVDSGISIVDTSGSSSTAVMTQAAVSASVAAVQSNLDSVSGSISSSISESNARIEEVATDLSENYARNDGSYDSMAVGVANNLAGDQEVRDTFISRTAGGDAEVGNGTAQIVEARGKSIVWNQLCSPTTISESTFTDGVKVNTDGIKVIVEVASGGATALRDVYIANYNYNIPGQYGHSRIFYGAPANAISAGIKFTTGYVEIPLNSILTEPVYAIYFGIRIPQGTAAGTYVFYPQATDLTLIFGAGNEPSTVEEFEAWLEKNIGALDYYPYNAGTVLNNSMEGIETIGFNLLDPATGKAQILGKYSDLYGNYYGITGTHGTVTFEGIDGSEITITPDAEGKFELTVPGVLTVANPGDDCAVFLWWDGTKTDYEEYDRNVSYLDVKHIYGRLNGSGSLVQVFPNGMAGIGDVKDVLRNEDGVAVARRKTGEVDLGTLTWMIDTMSGIRIFKAYVTGGQGVAGEVIVPANILTPIYATVATSALVAKDKQIRGQFVASPNYTLQLGVRDSDYDNATADDFKAAMSGTPLYFELATEELYTDLVYIGSSHFADNTAVTLPVTYTVDNWGIENILPKNTSASVSTAPADLLCKYTMDAVEMINTHSDQIEDLYDSKADKNGTYPGLVAGNLVDADGVGSEQQFMFRPTGGTQAVAEKTQAVLQKYMGKSLVWNQPLMLSVESQTINGVTITNNNDGTFSVNGTATADIRISVASGEMYFGSHKFYISGCVGGNIQTFFLEFGNVGACYDGVIYPSSYDNQCVCYLNIKNGVSISNKTFSPQLFDLTLMFGAGNEPSTAEEFEALFPLPYYAYNEGTLISNKADSIETVGFNQWDEEWELGSFDNDGNPSASSNTIRSKNYIPVLPNTRYCQNGNYELVVVFYDANYNVLQYVPAAGDAPAYLKFADSYTNIPLFTTPANCAYIKFRVAGAEITSYAHDICINISDSAKNGTYEPYEKHSTQIGLGEFKVKDSEGNEITVNGLKSAGSVYDEIDPVRNKYIKRVGSVDLGNDLNWTYQSYGQGDPKNYFYHNNFSEAKIVVSSLSCICERYLAVMNVDYGSDLVNEGDKVVSFATDANKLCIRDTSYTSVEDFRNSVKGVMLYYELATPIEYDLVGSIPETYPAFGVGTEAIEPSGVDEETGVPETAPFRAVIFYSKDYLSQLNNMPEDYTSKESLVNMLEALKTAGIIASYTMTWDSTTGRYTFTITAPTPAS